MTGRLDVVEHAIHNWGASASAVDDEGNTGLHLSAQNDNTKVMHYFLGKMTREQAVAKNHKQETALMHFIKSPEKEIFPEEAKSVKKILAKHHSKNIDSILEILSEFLSNSTSQCDKKTDFVPITFPTPIDDDINAFDRQSYDFLEDFSPEDDKVDSITPWLHWDTSPLKSHPFSQLSEPFKLTKIRTECEQCCKRIHSDISEFKSSLFGTFVKAKIKDWILALIACDSQVAFERIVTICLYTSPTFHPKSNLSLSMIQAGAGQSISESAEYPHACKCKVLQLFIYKLTGAIDSLPKDHRYGYRGESSTETTKLDSGSVLLYHNFASASTNPSVAKMFGSTGVLMCLVSSSAPVIKPFSSLQHEEEFLFRPNCRLRIQWKLSSSLLRMLSCSFDVLVLYEINPLLSSTGQSKWKTVQTILQSIRDVSCSVSDVVFKDFLKEYIEAKLDTETASSVGLYELLKQWITSSDFNPIVIEGTPGSGKTSAGIAAVQFLASHKIEVKEKVESLGWGSPFGFFSTHPSNSITEVADNREIFPIFIPLPKVRDLFSENAIDNYILNTYLAINEFVSTDEDTEKVINWLLKTYKMVVILDSLDEIMISLSVMSKSSLNLVKLNSFLSKCRILLTTRSSFIERHATKPTDFLGKSTNGYCLRPFSTDEKERYIENKYAFRAKSWLKQNNLWTEVENPFLLSMAVAAQGELSRKPSPEICVTTCDVYEGYFKFFKSQQQLREPDNTFTFDEVIKAAEQLACKMTRLGIYEAPIAVFYHESKSDLATIRSLLKYLPLRIEDLHDPHSAITFRHNTFADFLVARALWDRPVQLLTEFFNETNMFSNTSGHGILDMYRNLLKCDPSKYDTLEEDLVQLVIKSRSGLKQDVAVGSNSLSLLCAAGRTLAGRDLSGIIIENTDLSRCCFSGVNFQLSVFKHCNFKGTQFHNCDLGHVDFTDSDLLMAAAPLRGHTNVVLAVAYSKCGRYLASGSRDATVKIWSSAGDLLHSLKSHNGLVTGLSFSNCGSLLASSSQDSTIKLWDVDQFFSPIITLRGHTSRVNCVAYSRCSSYIASGSNDNSVRVWCANSATVLSKLNKHVKPVTSVQFSASGEHLVSTSKDSFAIVWQVRHNSAPLVDLIEGGESPPVVLTMKHKLGGHVGAVSCGAISKCCNYVFTGGSDMTLRKWNISTGKPLRQFRGSGRMSEITSLACSPSGERLISGGFDNLIRVWDTTTGRQVTQFESTCSDGVATSIAYSNCGSYIASGSPNNIVNVWNSKWTSLRRIEKHHNGASTAIFSNCGKDIISGGRDGTVRVWSSSTGKEIYTMDTSSDCYVITIATSVSGDMFAAGGSDCLAYIWHTRVNNATHVLRGHSKPVLSVAFSPSGIFLVSADASGLIAVWESHSGKFIANCTSSQCKGKGHSLPVNFVAFSSCENFIMSKDIHNHVRYWYFQDRRRFQPQSPPLPDVVFLEKKREFNNEKLLIEKGDIRLMSNKIRLCIGGMDKNLLKDCNCSGILPESTRDILKSTCD